jgi:hypothetical protein
LAGGIAALTRADWVEHQAVEPERLADYGIKHLRLAPIPRASESKSTADHRSRLYLGLGARYSSSWVVIVGTDPARIGPDNLVAQVVDLVRENIRGKNVLCIAELLADPDKAQLSHESPPCSRNPSRGHSNLNVGRRPISSTCRGIVYQGKDES